MTDFHLHQRITSFSFSFLLILTAYLFLQTATALAQSSSTIGPNTNSNDNQTGPVKSNSSSQQDEVERLRGEVKQLRADIDRLSKMVEALVKDRETAATQGSQEKNLPQQRTDETQVAGAPQSTSAPDDARLAMATKAQGGDLSGAGNLLRTDRITIGGYGEMQFRESSINEKTNGGGKPTFLSPRFVLGIAAVLSEKQNVVFNSELEYEFGGKEVEVEQAFVEWKARPEFAFRGGIFVPAIGRFNVYHDSNLNLTTIRPLVNQFIVPTAYSDAGVGVRGRFKLPHKMKLSYEFDVVNGMSSAGEAEEGKGKSFISGGEEGEATPFSRFLGQVEAAEIKNLSFQDNNRNKAIIGRIGFSPINGLEFGASGYTGKITDDDDAPISANIFFFDASFHRGNFQLNAEYGRSNIVGGGIRRRSPAAPIFNPNDEESAEELAEFLEGRTPGQDGFYVEASYQFRPSFVVNHFDESGYIAPVFRYEAVRLDRTLKDFYLNRSRATLGLNIAPSSSVIFKLNYLFNHTFGPVPRLSGEIEEEFGKKLLPFNRYGRNGFTGSITYVF